MIIKSPDNKHEFNQIHRLNHKTFVEEIPQHPESANQLRVDPFHPLNQYIIAVENNNLLGMVCYNTQRPFSLEKKGVSIEGYLSGDETASDASLAEIRLLAVEKQHRNKSITLLLLKGLVKELTQRNIFKAVISAATTQLELYRKIGFTPFGELVGKPGAFYQPMFISFDDLKPELRP